MARVRLAIVATLLLAACSKSDGPVDGPKLFARVCAPCHGTDGHAQTPQGRLMGAKDLHLDEARKMSDIQIETQIRLGKNKMPAFGPALSDGEIKALVGEVRKIQAR